MTLTANKIVSGQSELIDRRGTQRLGDTERVLKRIDHDLPACPRGVIKKYSIHALNHFTTHRLKVN